MTTSYELDRLARARVLGLSVTLRDKTGVCGASIAAIIEVTRMRATISFMDPMKPTDDATLLEARVGMHAQFAMALPVWPTPVVRPMRTRSQTTCRKP